MCDCRKGGRRRGLGFCIDPCCTHYPVVDHCHGQFKGPVYLCSGGDSSEIYLVVATNASEPWGLRLDIILSASLTGITAVR